MYRNIIIFILLSFSLQSCPDESGGPEESKSTIVYFSLGDNPVTDSSESGFYVYRTSQNQLRKAAWNKPEYITQCCENGKVLFQYGAEISKRYWKYCKEAKLWDIDIILNEFEGKEVEMLRYPYISQSYNCKLSCVFLKLTDTSGTDKDRYMLTIPWFCDGSSESEDITEYLEEAFNGADDFFFPAQPSLFNANASVAYFVAGGIFPEGDTLYRVFHYNNGIIDFEDDVRVNIPRSLGIIQSESKALFDIDENIMLFDGVSSEKIDVNSDVEITHGQCACLNSNLFYSRSGSIYSISIPAGKEELLLSRTEIASAIGDFEDESLKIQSSPSGKAIAFSAILAGDELCSLYIYNGKRKKDISAIITNIPLTGFRVTDECEVEL